METKKAIIVFEDYLIEPDNICSDRFNLYKKSIGKKGKSEGKETISTVGYGYTFGGVLDKIASIKTAENTEVSTIKEYITEYRKWVQTLAGILK